MNKDQREIERKLRILRYAEEIGHVAKACRYFGIGRSSFYRWRQAYAERGEAGLVNAPPIPKWHANRTPPEREEKVIYLRRKYHLGPMRIVWYLERSHRSDQQEFYQLLSYKGDVDLKARLGEWERFYNFHRPHGAHNGKTPYEALREKL